MKIFISALFLIVFVGYSTAVIQNYWPPLVGRCAQNDPELSSCMQNMANAAILPVLIGDPSIGLTNLLENQDDNLIDREISLGENQTWKVNMTNANYYGLPHMFVSGMSWDFDNRIVNINFTFDSSIVISGVYSSSGTIGDTDFSGYGNAFIILVGGVYGSNISYTMNYNLMNVGGQEYVDPRNVSCAINSPYRFDFSNLAKTLQQTTNIADIMNSNADTITEEINPQVNVLCASIVTGRLLPFFFNFPLSMIFV